MDLANVKNQITIANSSMEALREAQEAFRGEAERAGLKNEDDVVDLIKEIRNERMGEKNADHA